MQVVVIGAKGFVGLALTRYLFVHGDHVIGMDLNGADDCHGRLNFRAVDVRSEPVEIPTTADVVFYLAQSPAYRGTGNDHADLFLVNTCGALRAYYAAVCAGAKGFIYASTGNVYAPSFAPLGEDAPTRGDQPYVLSKLMVEEWLETAASEIPSVCLRLFGVFGPDQQTMLPAVLRSRLQSGEVITLDRNPLDPSDVDGLRVSFSYVEDVVSIFRKLALRVVNGKSVPARLNVAGPQAISLRRFAEGLGRGLECEPVFQVADSQRAFDLVADISRLESLVDVSFTPFEEAIALCIK